MPLRGDTEFTQTKHLDRWDNAGYVRFIFGYESNTSPQGPGRRPPGLRPTASWNDRPRYEIKTAPRQQPERVKPEIVNERGFETIHLLEEMIAEFKTIARSPAAGIIG